MPGAGEDVVAAVFAGEGLEIASSDTAQGRHNGYMCRELRGFQVELRGTVLNSIWMETADVSAQPIG